MEKSESDSGLEGLIEDCDTLYYYGRSNTVLLTKEAVDKLELFKNEFRSINEKFGFNEFGAIAVGKNINDVYIIYEYYLPKTYEFMSECEVPDNQTYTKYNPEARIGKLAFTFTSNFLERVRTEAHRKGLEILGYIHSHPPYYTNAEIPSVSDTEATMLISESKKGGICQLFLANKNRVVTYNIKAGALNTLQEIIKSYSEDKNYKNIFRMIFPPLVEKRDKDEIRGILKNSLNY